MYKCVFSGQAQGSGLQAVMASESRIVMSMVIVKVVLDLVRSFVFFWG